MNFLRDKKRTQIEWGITANSHDAALAVVKTSPEGPEILYAAHAERSSGRKNDAWLNETIVAQAREYGEPDNVHWYENFNIKRLRQVRSGQWSTAWNKVSPWETLEKLDVVFRPHYPPISAALGGDPGGPYPPNLIYHKHHASHAAAGYFTSPFREAAVLVIDSIGEFETLTIWQGKDRSLKRTFSQSYPHSVGLWYSSMTQRIGLKPNEDEYILMGWAALGDPERFKKKIYEDFFHPIQPGSPKIRFKHNLHRGCRWWAPELNSLQDYADIAAGTQAVYEMIFDHLLKWISRVTNNKNIVIMGGCALNCVANGRAYRYFDNVWIMPNPGDAGSSLGCVLDSVRDFTDYNTAYLGYNIPGDYPIENTIQELKTTRMVGVANGRAEFGPRALGNRSLFADPRGDDVQDLVNTVKKRQPFRPFAPVVKADRVHEYFDMPPGCDHSQFMQFIAKTKHPDQFPAITHYDGTSRVQTVTAEQHPGLYRLLDRWESQTGCPILLNTSLNIKGEPMVDTEADAKRWYDRYGVKVLTKEGE